jgi:segregation and condensation protein B
MNEFYTRNVLEAALLAAGKPLTVAELGQLFDENTRPKVDDIRATLEALAAEYSNRGLEVKETAAGFRIQVRREFASEISRLWPERPARYSRALLETLALIAYRQPITRAEIEAVRGVAVNPNIVKTVIERNWVRVVGHRDVPGRPELLGTTREFLDYFGLRSLDELPPLAELKAMGDYNLQLELPNAGALGVEKVDGDVEVEGTDGVAVAVAGLLTADADSDAGGEISPDGADALADGAAVAAVAEGDGAGDSVADAAGVHDEGASRAAVAASGDATDSAHDAGAEHAATRPSGAGTDSAHDAVGDAAGIHDETEADRTLTSGTVSKHAADSEEADTSDPAISSESLDADDASDDDADEDELSADGHGSRELVAAPRDIDD